MAVYVDQAIWERWERLWCHLLADDEAELHAFAQAIGCKRERFQSKPRRPWIDHYDIDEERRAEAVQAGAIELTRREVCELIARKRAQRGRCTSTVSPTATRPPSSTLP